MEVQDSLYATAVLDGLLATTDEAKAFDGAQVRARGHGWMDVKAKYLHRKKLQHVSRFTILPIYSSMKSPLHRDPPSPPQLQVNAIKHPQSCEVFWSLFVRLFGV